MLHPGPSITRLGVMGGSFDPVHVAHLIMAEAVREALALDLVLFVPVGQQPLKQGNSVTGAEHRVAMLQLAIEGNPCFALSRVDVDRPGPSYTADTLEQLRAEWDVSGHLQMWFIVGADSIATFPRWRDPQRILDCARLAGVRRPGVDLDPHLLSAKAPLLQGHVDWVDAPLVDISATDLRRRVKEGRSIKYRVPVEVEEYINAHGLYR